MANSLLERKSIQALLANHLIALDKCPDIRPIRISEILYHIIGQVVCLVTWGDAEPACGARQLCAGISQM